MENAESREIPRAFFQPVQNKEMEQFLFQYIRYDARVRQNCKNSFLRSIQAFL